MMNDERKRGDRRQFALFASVIRDTMAGQEREPLLPTMIDISGYQYRVRFRRQPLESSVR
jgi:hypothetical protein